MIDGQKVINLHNPFMGDYIRAVVEIDDNPDNREVVKISLVTITAMLNEFNFELNKKRVWCHLENPVPK